MTPQRYQLVKSIFLDVCRSVPDQRAAVLLRECGDDAELRTEVESLLDQDQQTTRFMAKTPVIDREQLWQAAQAVNGTAYRPERIGQYRILDVLGEGGMGMVYLAEQDNPRRPVALKIIRPGIASEPVMRRFEFEAQLLGRLHHPGIAQVYEAGTADTGLGPQPFFAMELIKGRTLTDYADANDLTIRQRLELLAKICDAVHHAHQKGVIHRDLKPGNILVEDEATEGTRHQASGTSAQCLMPSAELGQPKILDFGVARAIDTDPGKTMRTTAGQLVGTLAYMSPEQVAGDPHDVDIRSDVYALGVIYYEMLSDELPHDLDGKSIPESLRIIKEQAIKPLGAADKALRGDLETIVGKALEKDRARRYQSALELAEDTRRYLSDQPILARPPSLAYSFGKFVKRNKLMVSGIAAGILAVVGILGWVAEGSRADAERHAKQLVERSYTSLAGLLEGNLKLPEGGDPLVPRLSDLNLLTASAEWIEQYRNDEPLMSAKLANLVAQNYLMWEDYYDHAQQSATLALDILSHMQPVPESVVAASLHTLGRAFWHSGDFVTAESKYRQALALWIKIFGEQNREATMTMQHIAACLRDQERFDEAMNMAIHARDLRQKFLDGSHADVIAGINCIGTILEKQKEFGLAADQFQEALAKIRAKAGENDLRTARTKRHIAACWIRLGDPQELAKAEQYLLEALNTQEQKLNGRENRQVAETLREMARLYEAREDYDRAVATCAQALEIQRLKLGANHAETLETQQLFDGIQRAAATSTTP